MNDLQSPRHPGKIGLRALMMRAGIVILVTLPILWLTLAVSLATVLARSNPSVALMFWPWHADATAVQAQRVIQASTRLDGRRANASAVLADLARRVISREPINASGARALALQAALQGNPNRYGALLTYAQSLSRRDAQTQILLIEEAVRRNDISGALRHYDIVLRTSRSYDEILLPQLAKGVAELEIAKAVTALVRTNPVWWRRFVEQMMLNRTTPSAITEIMLQAKISMDNAEDRALVDACIRHLIERRAYSGAYRLYGKAANFADVRKVLLRDGDFSRASSFPFFEWETDVDPGVYAYLAPRPASAGQAMSLNAAEGRSGVAVRQLMVLQPGRYLLGADFGSVSGTAADRPRLRIICVEDGQQLLDLTFPVAPASGVSAKATFEVKRDCPAQWIAVLIVGSQEGRASDSWVDSISVAPLLKEG